ncbi:protoporphyrinogen oxidase [Aquibacillus koreensis]|uniref:Coproporphyrinogen III oxidase n=1 Tax=Aquibacillus koreensis TaxID=279446 RepID=A0A9X4AHW7_9BACI|nr:protoporphyrinogen oxidase [Aquibacillus koreensis]MCT2535586.1 protoporphyrinogen oxidase [Aquibacillus koreensis]MDC3420129.1 protoporphyrinogen oxidase [Aquibacillus koreensis]
MKQIAIIGGGITGLTAAYYLQEQIKEQQLPYEIKLIEASDQLGGKIKTVQKNGYTIERGPDSFLIRKASAAKLAKEVGLADALVKNGSGGSYILVNDKLHKMPSGSFMGIPTEVRPFLFSSLFSWKGKFRAAFDFILPKGEPVSDQSLGLFFRRRFGDELVENLVEPLLSGIYAGDIDDLSLMATFPNFYQLEQKHRSLVKGLNVMMPKKKQAKGVKKPSMFYSLKGGLQALVEAIEVRLNSDAVMKGVSVDQIERMDGRYHLSLDDESVYEADAVVIASPYFAAQNMLRQYTFMDAFNDMRATSVANVVLAFDQAAIKQDIDGTGFVVSRNSSYRITACTWTHKKWPETAAPEGKALLRCYLGKPGDEDVVNLSDEELEEIVLNDLNKTMHITDKPEFSVITRWKNAMPQYSVGHKERIHSVMEQMKEHTPGVFLAGGSYQGIGIPDCIDQGEAAVTKVLEYLKS